MFLLIYHSIYLSLHLGHHVCLMFTQYAPYTLKNGTWDEQTREDYANVVFDAVEKYAPGFK